MGSSLVLACRQELLGGFFDGNLGIFCVPLATRKTCHCVNKVFNIIVCKGGCQFTGVILRHLF